jgi:hypothetical protein
MSCPENGSCYGPNEKAHDRIIPFSFFPFHLMAFDTYPVDVIDYLNAPFPKAVEMPQEDQKEPPAEAALQPRAEVEQPEERAAAVIDILMTLRKKWSAALNKTEKQPVNEKFQETLPQSLHDLPVEMLEKTMIFSPGDLKGPPHEPKKATEKSDPAPSPAGPHQAPSDEPDLEKTMIFSPGMAAAPPSAKKTDRSAKVPASEPPRPTFSLEDLPADTPPPPPQEKNSDTAKKKKPALESEALLETVIMSLDDLKGKK